MEKKPSKIDRKIKAIEELLAMLDKDFQETMKDALGNFDLFEDAGLLKSEEPPEIPAGEIEKMEAEAEIFLSRMPPEEKKKFEELSDETLGFDKVIRYIELLEDLKDRLRSLPSPFCN